MTKTRIHVTTSGLPTGTIKRRLGRVNIGAYCEKCQNLMATAIAPEGVKSLDVEITSDGPIDIQCPMCGHLQKRAAADFAPIFLTENNKRKPPPLH